MSRNGNSPAKIPRQGRDFCEDNAGQYVLWLEACALGQIEGEDRDKLPVEANAKHARYQHYGGMLTPQVRRLLR